MSLNYKKLASQFAFISLMTGKLMAWIPGHHAGANGGFVVDTLDRMDVLKFYQSVYIASEGYQNRMAWTGVINGNSSTAGTTSTAFQNDVMRRINFYRALSGVNANVVNATSPVVIFAPDANKPNVATSRVQACQEAALMIARNVNSSTPLTHTPPATWESFTAAGWNGLARGNLAFGFYGPGAIDAYMNESFDSLNNSEKQYAGHRRWMMFPTTAQMATGDISKFTIVESGQNFQINGCNTLYVIDNWTTNPANQFVTWPNAGYTPSDLATPIFSVSYPSATFTNSTVSVQVVGGAVLPVTILSRNQANTGLNTLVFNVANLPSAQTQDVTLQVTVNQIGGGGPTSYTYQTTYFNPNRLLTNPPSLLGTLTPPLTGANYQYTNNLGSDEQVLHVSKESNVNWTEGLETEGTFIYQTQGYPNRVAAAKATGSFGLNLNLSSALPTLQTAELDRWIIPAADSQLSFKKKRRLIAPQNFARVQITEDDGLNWITLWTDAGDGTSGDTAFVNVNLPLSDYAGKVVRFRFIIERPNPFADVYFVDNFASFSPDLFGIFFDDITVTGSDKWLEQSKYTNYQLTSGTHDIALNATTAGASLVAGSTYYLRMAPKFGFKQMNYSAPVKVVPANLTGYSAWREANFSGIGNFDQDADLDGLPNGLEYALSQNPKVASDLSSVMTRVIEVGQIRFRFPRNAEAVGFSISARQSSNLTHWEAANLTTTPTHYEVIVPTTATKKLIQLRAVQP